MDTVGRLPERVAESLRSLPHIERGLVVAVSGGPDSVALLRAALAVRESVRVGPIVLAHLNHQLRGTESDADEAFIEELHARLATSTTNLLLRHDRIDVAAAAQATGENLEATARRIRYRWLAEVARAQGMRWVATGHTADDQAETLIHRLLRGAGLQGLRGIAARRELEPGVHLVRPLLSVTRGEVLEYLQSLNQESRHDSTNDDLRLTRNRIRWELLPLLAKQYNPGIVEVLCRLAEQADAAFSEQESATEELLRKAERPRAGDLFVFDRAVLAGAMRHLVRSVFRRLWQREGWPVDSMNYAAWDRVTRLAFGEEKALDLPGGIRARLKDGVVQISRVVPRQQESQS